MAISGQNGMQAVNLTSQIRSIVKHSWPVGTLTCIIEDDERFRQALYSFLFSSACKKIINSIITPINQIVIMAIN